MRRTWHKWQKTPIIHQSVDGSIAAVRRWYAVKAKYTKLHCRNRSKNALLKHESFSRALRCLHEAEQTPTASTQLFDTLERRHALTVIVGDIETLQRRLSDLIELAGMDDKSAADCPEAILSVHGG
jgi:NAD-dependent SIR2 family protein deacetylase